jgi:hypothetical protein
MGLPEQICYWDTERGSVARKFANSASYGATICESWVARGVKGSGRGPAGRNLAARTSRSWGKLPNIWIKVVGDAIEFCFLAVYRNKMETTLWNLICGAVLSGIWERGSVKTYRIATGSSFNIRHQYDCKRLICWSFTLNILSSSSQRRKQSYLGVFISKCHNVLLHTSKFHFTEGLKQTAVRPADSL